MDHERLRISQSPMSCGIAELSGITDASDEDVLFAIGTNLYHPARGNPVAFLLYSNTVDDKRWPELASTIVSLRLGDVDSTHEALNPKTGNMIYVITWLLNHEVFRSWWNKEKLARLQSRYGDRVL
jgi:hypothetical protein